MKPSRTVADVGEFGLIDRISSIVGDGGAVVGIGDDTAVIEIEGPDYLLATVDMLVENVHFHTSEMSARDVGRRALAVNISDIAAMGGQPTFALTSLAVPPHASLDQVEDMYGGMKAEAEKFGVGIIGGNLARVDGPLVLDVTMLGLVARSQLILRRGAVPGDVLVVTGVLGGAAARRLKIEPRTIDPSSESDYQLSGPWVPEPRVTAARALARLEIVHAMLDVSDGLAADLHHLADSSQVGAMIYSAKLPIAPAARQLAATRNLNVDDLVLFGGEEYELLMAMPAGDLKRAQDAVGDLPLHVVGKVLDRADGISIERVDSSVECLPSGGWTHF